MKAAREIAARSPDAIRALKRLLNAASDADMGTIAESWFTRTEAILLGRNTYETMRAYWSQVTDPAGMEKYPDLLAQYFGPPSPKSTAVRVPRLADPDYLLEVQAIAAVK